MTSPAISTRARVTRSRQVEKREASAAIALGTADCEILETGGADLRRLVEIASVEDERRAQRADDAVKVGTAELLPLGDNDETVGAADRLHRRRRISDGSGITVQTARFGHRDGIVRDHPRAAGDERRNDLARRSLAHVVGVR